MADQALRIPEDNESWDVRKIMHHLKETDTRGTYYTMDEVFPDV